MIALGATFSFLAIAGAALTPIAPEWVVIACLAPLGVFLLVLIVFVLVMIWFAAIEELRE